jgi:hypothetical protein
MERYIGLDVHATSCTMAIMNAAGKRVSWQVVETNGAALVEAVKTVRGAVRVCMEEGTQSSWLYEILSPLVEEVVVVAITEKPSGNKNDTEDAFRLAEMHRTRSFKRTVYKHVGKFKTLRSLVKAYGFLTGDVVRSQVVLQAFRRCVHTGRPGGVQETGPRVLPPGDGARVSGPASPAGRSTVP